jgi:ribosome-associated translation inhibitor RaiA
MIKKIILSIILTASILSAGGLKSIIAKSFHKHVKKMERRILQKKERFKEKQKRRYSHNFIIKLFGKKFFNID